MVRLHQYLDCLIWTTAPPLDKKPCSPKPLSSVAYLFQGHGPASWLLVKEVPALHAGLAASFSLTLTGKAMAASTPKPAWVDALFAALPGTILLPGSQDFEDSDSRYYTAANTEIESAAVARPTSTADVSKLITVLRRDVPDHVPIAIHGAGHATARGAAKAEGGVTIDTRGLKGVEILPGNHSVRISAGETWRDVFRLLEAHRPPLAVAGGRMGQVGVIGYLLGGGVSHFSTAVGFAVDAVVSWEVVLASGETVTATKRENPDLWDALRGGSNNFGVVTAVELQCFDHPQSFRGGFAYYLPFARNSTLKALVDHGAAGAPGPAAPISHVMWSMTYTAGVKVINTILTTTGPANAEDMRAFTNVWGRVPMTGTLRPSTVGEFVERQSKLSPASGSRFGQPSTAAVCLNAMCALTIAAKGQFTSQSLSRWTWISSWRYPICGRHPCPRYAQPRA